MAKEEAAKPAEGKKAGSSKLLIIIAVAFVLLTASGAAAFLLLGKKEEAVTNTGVNDGAWVERKGEEGKNGEKAAAIYHTIKPTFVVKVSDGKRTRYLQVDVAVMARDQVVIDAVAQHRPLIMNDLLALFSDASFDELLSLKGKRRIQAKALTAINDILRREEKFSGVKAVLFTNFMVQ